ncbi:MAG: calcium/sodium antiporter [Defluviitaleaceae bacterium]|nr:calcium/sodium antiporter [Defluviitaleaceae bacterium]
MCAESVVGRILIFTVLFLVAGFLILIKGADIFVDASVQIARIFKIPNIIIGLTIVSLGTGAPEITVSLLAGIQGNSHLVMGNLVGSNIFNTMFILGICGLIAPLKINFKQIKWDFVASVLAAIAVLAILILSEAYIPRFVGGLLLIGFTAYMSYTIRHNMANSDDKSTEKPSKSKLSSVVFCLLGLGMVIGGAHLAVENAITIAESLGVSERVIGLTIIAIGTGLPELMTSVVAFKKGQGEIALGNIIGSNVLNLLLVLGLTSAISLIYVDPAFIIDTVFLVIVSIITLVFIYTGQKVTRWEGALLMGLYIGYMVLLI